MATIGTVIYSFLHGKQVGTDAYGNRYFEARRQRASTGHKKRWVLFQGLAEPSKVPPAWHGWLHYTLDAPLIGERMPNYPWLKAPQPNLTGTVHMHLPQGHMNRLSQHAPTIADYEPWTPL